MNTAKQGNISDERQYGIKEICAITGLSPVYVRRMIQHGKIQTTKIEIGKNTFKHFVSESELNRWRSSTEARTTREDGRNKFVMYATPAEFEAIQKLLGEYDLQTPIRRANKVKELEDGTDG